MRKKSLTHLIICSLLFISTQTFAGNDLVQWGYTGTTAPQNWQNLNPSFSLCGSGHMQSPINILSAEAKTVPNQLSLQYQQAPLSITKDSFLDASTQAQSIEDKGHGIQINFSQNNENVIFGNQNYQLFQFHFHTPSENELNGQQYPLEIHFVHESASGQLLVIAVFVKTGAANPTLANLISHFPSTVGQAQVFKNDYINPTSLLPANLSYYSYVGSLTTPPCTEKVQWLVMANPITASQSQIEAFTLAAGGKSARPVQPLNGRVVNYVIEPTGP